MFWDTVTATFPNQTALMLGLCFLLIVYLIPNGFVGLFEKYYRRVKGEAAAPCPPWRGDPFLFFEDC